MRGEKISQAKLGCKLIILKSLRSGKAVKMNHYVYILECSDGSLYVGCTNNLKKRLKEHNESRYGAHYTKIRRPVNLKYHEIFESLKDARSREVEIKKWTREKKVNLIDDGQPDDRG